MFGCNYCACRTSAWMKAINPSYSVAIVSDGCRGVVMQQIAFKDKLARLKCRRISLCYWWLCNRLPGSTVLRCILWWFVLTILTFNQFTNVLLDIIYLYFYVNVRNNAYTRKTGNTTAMSDCNATCALKYLHSSRMHVFFHFFSIFR